ncbi:MAG: hypothetical protein SAK29_03230 [Scytonema sp. PMC 1069.18]|nr:hypothetical protein [Scytonema sp. PMC 1069.18]MEC4884550.1 hypothetical protein [Scytonema sp. PMC 1070.18]
MSDSKDTSKVEQLLLLLLRLALIAAIATNTIAPVQKKEPPIQTKVIRN